MEVDRSLLMKSSELKLLVDTLLEASADLPLDILHTDPHPSELSLVLLAAEVYTEKESGETDEDYGMYLDLPKGWQLLATGSNSGRTNGYFGAAFADVKSQQVVVAHRGTIPTETGALLTDVLGVCGTKYTGCMNSAITFVDQIRQVLHSVNTQHGRSYNLTITGHSLGGWLAQITTFTVKWLNASDGILKKNTSSGLHAKTVVFDSPGAKEMLNKMSDDYYYRSTTNVLDWLDITIYVSVPNRINTCGAHVGRVYRVSIDASTFSWKDIKTGWYNVRTHEIYNFTNAFKQKSPIISKVLDWAKDRAEFSLLFGKQALNSVNNYHYDFNVLIEKLNKIVKRYKVVPVENQSNAEITATIHFDAFSEDEFKILNQLMIIQKHQRNYEVLTKLVSVKNLILKNGNLFPHFEINHNNRKIICQSKQQLGEVRKRVKQLMRWLGTEFSEAVEEQSRHADLIYRDAGQTYLDQLSKTLFNFTDSIGLQEFLLSSTDRVLWIVSTEGSFEMTRLHNVFCQIKEKINTLSLSNQYTGENQHVFLNWSQLQKLYKNYGSPIDQNNLMIIDGSSSSTLSLEVFILLKNYVHCPSSIIKKFVFISPEPTEDIIFNSLENIKEVIVTQKINLMNLSTESQKTVLQRKLILIGSMVYSFQDFFAENCSIPEINQCLCSHHFKKIVTDEDYIISITDTRPTISDLQMPLIKTDIETSKEYLLNCVDLLNSLVVISGLEREDLEIGACWEQLAGKDIILAEGEVPIFFKDTCDKNQYKTIYLFEVSGDDKANVHCKQIFNQGFYVPRKFVHRTSINFTKYNHSEDIFVICSEENKASLLGLIENCEKRKKISKNLHIAATKKEEIDIIQRHFNKNIHFVKICLSEESRELEWRYSHGSVEGLRLCVSKEFFEPIDEQTLCETERKLVIITDEPGMGKTTSLANLSRLIETAWVIHIELKQFKAQIDSLSDEFTPQNVTTFLLSEGRSSADSSLAQRLFKYILQSKTCSKRVILMFDGFDELDDYIKNKDSSKDKLIKLFNFLQSKPSIQVFLTTRKYLKDLLETKLNQFSTSFIMINTQEQREFLFMFWRSFLSLELGVNREEADVGLKKYTEEVLRKAKHVLGPDMDCFMGIPLQLRMLAEVFRPQSDLLIQSVEDLYERINIVSAPNLYKMFLSLKYDIYLHDKTLIGKALDEDEILEYTKSLTKDHGELGFRTFFTEFYESNKNYFEDISEKRILKLNRLGLIQSKGNGEFQFVHRTYAEYCCAQIVVKWLNQPERFEQDSAFKYQLIKDILLPKILLQPESKVIRLFINVELEESEMSDTTLRLNAEHISRLWYKENSIFRNEEHNTALHVAVQEKNEHIITFLLSGLDIYTTQEAFISLFTQYDMDCNIALHLMDKQTYRSKTEGDLLQTIIGNIFKRIEACSRESKEKILYACFFNQNISKSHILQHLLYLADDCGDSSSVFKRVVTRAKKVSLEISTLMEALLEKYVKPENKMLSEPLENNIEHYCLLLVKHEDHKLMTALHLAAQGGNLDAVKQIEEQTSVLFTALMARRDVNERTPLHIASECGHLDIVKFLLECGADIKTHSTDGKTALMYAAGEGHILVSKYLIERGAEINAHEVGGWRALDIAVHGGHFPIVEHLLQQGADPDLTDGTNGTDRTDGNDGEGRTALTVAVFWKRWDILRLLLERVVNVNADGGECLSAAIEQAEWSIVQLLVDKGTSIPESFLYDHISEFKEKFPNYVFRTE